MFTIIDDTKLRWSGAVAEPINKKNLMLLTVPLSVRDLVIGKINFL